MMPYKGKHRDDKPRPRCTCDRMPEDAWYEHSTTCAITREVRQRLHTGQGGTR